MNKYESIFIVSTLLEDEKIQEIIGTVKNLIESSGQLEKVDEWGKKRLAYEVNDQKEGYYVLMHFSAEPEFPTELERISDNYFDTIVYTGKYFGTYLHFLVSGNKRVVVAPDISIHLRFFIGGKKRRHSNRVDSKNMGNSKRTRGKNRF
jgi:small subunit ribosomal protein S6